MKVWVPLKQMIGDHLDEDVSHNETVIGNIELEEGQLKEVDCKIHRDKLGNDFSTNFVEYFQSFNVLEFFFRF